MTGRVEPALLVALLEEANLWVQATKSLLQEEDIEPWELEEELTRGKR